MTESFSQQFTKLFLALLLATPMGCDKGPAENSTTTGSSSMDSGSAETTLGSSSLEGDEICAEFSTASACAEVEVAPGVFCGWRSSAFVAATDQACESLQISEGCFAFPSAGGDPGCGSAPECETELGFLHPYIKDVEGGTLVVNACVGSAPSNDFTSCYSFESPRPVGCQCVCELAPPG